MTEKTIKLTFKEAHAKCMEDLKKDKELWAKYFREESKQYED